MLHNDVRIKTQFDRLSDIPPSTIQSLMTISYDTHKERNRISIPNARFSIAEDPLRLASLVQNLIIKTTFIQFSLSPDFFHTTVFSIHQQAGVDNNNNSITDSFEFSANSPRMRANL